MIRIAFLGQKRGSAKRLSCLLVCISIVFCAAASSNQKECRKIAKQMAKELLKDGWTVWGASQTMEGVLEVHFQALIENGQNVMEVKGRGKAKTENLALSKAKNNAIVQYAQMKGTHVESVEKMNFANVTANEEFTNEQFESTSNLKAEHKVEKMMPTVSLIKTLADGTFEALLFYIMVKEDVAQ